ncbi:hypothetical protein ABEW03_15980 [Virgibacillus pantothenticus]|uniref:Uncharacterized protein n=1 Tax=Virgibacillus chiguensis TaxID=411959 RepID=A0A1M5L4U1_9BACI|nr:hypothetical protein [Virgibacillus chiguensis]SHG60037.1 hypothetical protein SAMN05421807_1013 [Virgibacillus chiguensis]
MNTFIRRNKLNVALLLSCLITFTIVINKQLLAQNEIYNSNFVSVNSIFAGFLFTSLGIIVGILDKEIIVFLDKHGYLDSYINGIIIGLIMHILSAVLELLFSNIEFTVSRDTDIFIKEIVFSLFLTGLVFFIKSTFNVLKLIRLIRKYNKGEI